MKLSIYKLIPTSETAKMSLEKFKKNLEPYKAKVEGINIVEQGLYNISLKNGFLEFNIVYEKREGNFKMAKLNKKGELSYQKEPITTYHFTWVGLEKISDEDIIIYMEGGDATSEDTLRGYLLEEEYDLERVKLSPDTMDKLLHKYKTIKCKLSNITKYGDSTKGIVLDTNDVEGIYHSNITYQYYDKNSLEHITILRRYMNIYYRVTIKRTGEITTRKSGVKSDLKQIAKEIYLINKEQVG